MSAPPATDRAGSTTTSAPAASGEGATTTALAPAVAAPETSAVAVGQTGADVGAGLEQATSGVDSTDGTTASQQSADLPARLPAAPAVDLPEPQTSQPAAAPAAPELPVDPAVATDGAAGSAGGKLLGG